MSLFNETVGYKFVQSNSLNKLSESRQLLTTTDNNRLNRLCVNEALEVDGNINTRIGCDTDLNLKFDFCKGGELSEIS